MPTQKQLDVVFLDTCDKVATLSNCVSYKVGSVITRDNRIIATGYNGSPKGCINCGDQFAGCPTPLKGEDKEAHHYFHHTFEIHAELNAILHAAKCGISLNHTTLYCSLQPCFNCLKAICQSGVNRIVYGIPYHKIEYSEEIYDMVDKLNISLECTYPR